MAALSQFAALKFHSAVEALNRASEGDFELHEALKWHDRWTSLYAEYFREVVESDPRFAPLAIGFAERMREVIEGTARPHGIGADEIERIMGCPMITLRSFLQHFRIAGDQALIWLGGEQLATVYYDTFAKELH